MDITVELVAFVACAALIAAVVRLYDTPVTKANSPLAMVRVTLFSAGVSC